MQTAIFQLHAPRKISSAYANNYLHGCVHPERIMEEHDFVYITAGEWEITENGIPHQLNVDDFIVLSADIPHGGAKPCTDGTKTMFLHISTADDRFSESEQESQSEAYLPLHTVIHCQHHPQVKQTFEQIVNTFIAEEPYRESRLQTLFQTLLINLYDADHQRKSTQTNQLVKNVLQLIHHHPQQFYSNEELSAMFFVCSKTIVNHFKEHTGITPYQYQLRYKLHQVKALLITQPNIKLYEIADQFGFYDEFHLSHTFKNMFGVSPNEYRKANRNKTEL